MTIVEHKGSALPVPSAMEVLDRIPRQRHDDPDVYTMEAEILAPRVRQMACRPEEIRKVGHVSIREVWSDDGLRCPPIVDLEL